MTDIVERLRGAMQYGDEEVAASEIERLRAINKDLCAKTNFLNRDGARLEDERNSLRAELAASIEREKGLHHTLAHCNESYSSVRAKERERCAKVCDRLCVGDFSDADKARIQCAKAIGNLGDD